MEFSHPTGRRAFARGASFRGAARRGENPGVMVPVNLFVDGFNRGDAKIAASACAPSASIIDDFPPHQWQGANACANWFAAYNAMARKSGISDGVVT